MRNPTKAARALVLGTLVVVAGVSTAPGRAQESPGYLGQRPPGIHPELFAPGVISLADEHEFGSIFSIDGEELFYGVDVGGRSEIRHARLDEDGAWTAPERILAHDRYSYNDPFLSPDERRLYFISNRPLDGRGDPKDIDIWYVERVGDGWSDPVNVGPPINTSSNEYYISFTESGTLYFASNNHAEPHRQFDFDIFAAKPTEEGFASPTRLGNAVNTRGYEADAFVAYDESYLIFSSSRRQGFGNGDLYISFKEPEGSWSAAKNLGTVINTAGHELCPFVSKDGRYFFYTSDRDIYWVSAAVLESFRGAHGPPLPTAQDGQLLERTAVSLEDGRIKDQIPDDRWQQLQARVASVRQETILESITYVSDGLRVKGYLARPRAGENLPCVIFNRGGNREFGALTDLRAALLLGELARHGYVVVASQYRGNGGGEGREEFGGADVNDVLNLVPLLESLPEADASRIGIYGWSRGGMMTYLALRRSGRFKAAVIGAGVADSFATVERRPAMEERVYSELVPDWETRRQEALESRSALRWPEELHKETPILLLHGSADWRVDPTQALRMADALYEVRHPFRLIFFEGGDHGLSEFSDEVRRQVVDWLNRYVRDGKRWPSLEPHGD